MYKKYLHLALVFGFLISAGLAAAKGNFDYVTVKGPGIIGEIDITNPALTGDFFAFADFSKGDVPPPANPGQGYQIVRIYVEFTDSKPRDLPFDQLHYYPYTGYVYYDGLVDGSSEYDGRWYTANPSAEEPIRSALRQRALLAWVPFGVLVIILIVFFIAYREKPKKA